MVKASNNRTSVRYHRLPVSALNFGDGDHDDELSQESCDEDLIFTMSENNVHDKKGLEGGKIKGENDGKRTNSVQAMMHLLKANIGTGILAIPSAFKHSGLYGGLLTMPLFAIVCAHCMHLLMTANSIVDSRLGTGMIDYPELTEASFQIGPKAFQKLSKLSRWVINISLTLTQFGFCCVYSLFVAENVSLFIEQVSEVHFKLDVRLYLLILLPLFVVISWIRSLHALSLFSAFSNVLLCVGFVAIFVELFNPLPSVNSVPKFSSITDFPLYMGTAIYAFEGIGVILPLQQDMEEPKHLKGTTGVVNTGMAIVACLNTGIGFFGYLKYGDKILGSITLNLPGTNIYLALKLTFALAIFLTYPIQYYVPYNIIWPWAVNKYRLEERFGDSWKLRSIDMLCRTVLVIITLSLAAAIPQLELFISLVGAFAATCLALIFPPLLDLAVHWNLDAKTYQQSKRIYDKRSKETVVNQDNENNNTEMLLEDIKLPNFKWILVKDITICVIGLIGFTTGTYASIENIILSYDKK